MLDKIVALFHPEMAPLVNTLISLLSFFTEDYIKDKDARNAAIDAVIEILQQQKDK